MQVDWLTAYRKVDVEMGPEMRVEYSMSRCLYHDGSWP
jgi:hypothetical protein